MVARHNSPGIYNDIITQADCAAYNKNSAYELSASEYFDLISKQIDYSLHAKLISIGESIGGYDYKSDDNPAGTTCISRYSTLLVYLLGLGFFNRSDFSINSIESTSSGSGEVKNFVKSYIDKGYPVLVSLENTNTGARHACIAYSYDDNDVYVNMGWSGGNEHVPVSSRYNRYTSAMILDWKIEHKHTNNYVVYKKNIDGSLSTRYYCYDDSSIITSGHRHLYTYRYEQYDSRLHIAYCSC